VRIPDSQLPLFYLKPGEVCFSERPALVMTLLGSCISVTMFSAHLGFGGICHVMLPRCPSECCLTICDEAYRYMDCSVKGMVDEFTKKGACRGEIEVKVFGGSRILMAHRKETNVSVGSQNIEVAKETLLHEGLRVLVSHTGGTFGRKIFFFTHTGEVLMKKIRKSVLAEGVI
jgi:chemotaxis protein CheD